MPGKRRNWSKSETILAFDLYCRMGFSAIDKSKPEVIKLAALIGRTPSAVSLKMSNLAHFDSTLQARNIVGMPHASHLDEIVFQEYCQDIQELACQAMEIKKDLGVDVAEIEPDINVLLTCQPGEYVDALIKQRVGQKAFRQAVLNAYHGRCCITGLKLDGLLIASHIKPWAKCDEKTERTNPCNGLSLNPFHDKAFDKGLITIDKEYRILLSSKLKQTNMDEDTIDWLKKYEHKIIDLPNLIRPGKEFIEYHNDVVFIG